MNISEKTKKLIHIITDSAVSLMLTVSGILFSLSCYGIYNSQDKQMFTYESIGKAFSKIRIPIYITVALVIGAALVAVLLPKENAKLRAPKRIKTVCKKLARRVNEAELSRKEAAAIGKERKLRSVLFCVSVIFSTLTALFPLIYLFNPNTFPAEVGEYNREVADGFLFYLVMLLPLAVYMTVYYILSRASCVRETELLKDCLKRGTILDKNTDNPVPVSRFSAFFEDNKREITLGVRIAFIGCGLVFLLIGITNGGAADVLVKAVNICAECIGLG